MTTPEPTRADILNIAGVADLFAADAAIEDAFRSRPLTRQERVNKAAIQIIAEGDDPVAARAALFLGDLYRTGRLTPQAGE